MMHQGLRRFIVAKTAGTGVVERQPFSKQWSFGAEITLFRENETPAKETSFALTLQHTKEVIRCPCIGKQCVELCNRCVSNSGYWLFHMSFLIRSSPAWRHGCPADLHCFARSLWSIVGRSILHSFQPGRWIALIFNWLARVSSSHGA